MKNKRLAYVLLPVVILVWGLIFYRVWASVKPEEAVLPVTATALVSPGIVTTSTLPTLQLNYSDPFLGRSQEKQPLELRRKPIPSSAVMPASYRTFQPPTPVPSPPPAVAAPQITWPQVEYVGTIENQRKHTRVAMLTINGGHYLLQEKGEQHALVVETIFKDSVKVQFQRQHRVLHRLASR